jgi:hypothetical protein
MKWIKDNLISIISCLGGGYYLRFLNEYLGLSSSPILQDFLILTFVIMGFWQKKSSVLILSVLTILSLGVIEFYSPLRWNNLIRATLILILLSYLVVWSKNLNLKKRKL